MCLGISWVPRVRSCPLILGLVRAALREALVATALNDNTWLLVASQHAASFGNGPRRSRFREGLAAFASAARRDARARGGAHGAERAHGHAHGAPGLAAPGQSPAAPRPRPGVGRAAGRPGGRAPGRPRWPSHSASRRAPYPSGLKVAGPSNARGYRSSFRAHRAGASQTEGSVRPATAQGSKQALRRARVMRRSRLRTLFKVREKPPLEPCNRAISAIMQHLGKITVRRARLLFSIPRRFDSSPARCRAGPSPRSAVGLARCWAVGRHPNHTLCPPESQLGTRWHHFQPPRTEDAA